MTRTVSRREILRTAAWSVPLVVASAAVPHAAASGSVFASFHISGLEERVQTVRLLVVNSTASPSGIPVSVRVTGPGASQLMSVRDTPGWAATASYGNVLAFDRTEPLPASTSLLIEFDLLVSSEDDLLLVGELSAGSLHYGLSLSR